MDKLSSNSWINKKPEMTRIYDGMCGFCRVILGWSMWFPIHGPVWIVAPWEPFGLDSMLNFGNHSVKGWDAKEGHVIPLIKRNQSSSNVWSAASTCKRSGSGLWLMQESSNEFNNSDFGWNHCTTQPAGKFCKIDLMTYVSKQVRTILFVKAFDVCVCVCVSLNPFA